MLILVDRIRPVIKFQSRINPGRDLSSSVAGLESIGSMEELNFLAVSNNQTGYGKYHLRCTAADIVLCNEESIGRLKMYAYVYSWLPSS